MLPSAPHSNLGELKHCRMTSGYEFDDQTLSLDDSIALTVRRPPKPDFRQKFWTLVGR